MSDAIKELFKERKVSRRIGLLMFISFAGVAAIALSDYMQGNEDVIASSGTMLVALEGGILMGYIAVKNALTETPKAPKILEDQNKA